MYGAYLQYVSILHVGNFKSTKVQDAETCVLFFETVLKVYIYYTHPSLSFFFDTYLHLVSRHNKKADGSPEIPLLQNFYPYQSTIIIPTIDKHLSLQTLQEQQLMSINPFFVVCFKIITVMRAIFFTSYTQDYGSFLLS